MSFAQSAYIHASNTYENALDNDFRKSNGIFYTSLPLAELMLRDLKLPKDAVILDPCCGTGVFLYAATKQNYTRLYGLDLDKAAAAFCTAHLDKGHFATCDSIGQPEACTLAAVCLPEKPDAIIGNPPYVPLSDGVLHCDSQFRRRVSDCGNNLFAAALLRAFGLVKKDGLVSYIIPKNFLHVSSYSLLRQELLREKSIISIVDLGVCFKNVRGEQIVLTIRNSKPQPAHKIKMKRFADGRFAYKTSIPQEFYTNEILLFSCTADFSVYRRLSTFYPTIADQCSDRICRGKSTSDDAIPGKEIRKFGYKNHDVPQHGNQVFIQNIYSAEAGIIAAFGGGLPAAQTVTVLTDSSERFCRYLLGILHSRLCNFFLYKYCYNCSRLTMHTDAKYLKKIPLPSLKQQARYLNRILTLVQRLEREEYLGSAWFDAFEELNTIIYKAYNISRKEASYIDFEVTQIQSQRWLNNGQRKTMQ